MPRKRRILQQTFVGKLVDKRPKWDDDSLMCTRFHVKHICFNDCKNKNSHKPNSQVPEEKREEMRSYCKKVRKNA